MNSIGRGDSLGMDATINVMGLRERSKAKRRSAIISAAYQLFAEKGYAATTIADIAELAEVAPRTVSLYFPTKQDIVLAGILGIVDRLREALDTRSPDVPVLETILEAMRAELKRTNDRPVEMMNPILAKDPEIHGLLTTSAQDVRQESCTLIARELGVAPGDPRAEIVIAATVGIFEFALFATATRDVDEIINHARTFLLAGNASLARDST